MKMYKGFDKDLKCRDFRYEIGKTYTEDKAELCEVGFHACEHPLDCLNYYEPGESRYCEVDLDDVPDERGDDSKRVGKKITVQGEIGIAGLVKAAVNIGIEEAKSKTTGNRAHAATTGNCAHAATTGYEAHAATTGNCAHAATTGNEAHAATTGNYAHAATTGNYAHAATTGYEAHAATTGNYAHAATTGNCAHAATTGNRAHAAVSGKESIASALGVAGKAKGALGCWIVCAEWESKNTGVHIKCVKAAAVDGERIKADAWYTLRDGEFVEVPE